MARTIKLSSILLIVTLISIVGGRYTEMVFIPILGIYLSIITKKNVFQKQLLFVIFLVAILSSFSILYNSYNYGKFIQQFILLAVMIYSYNQILSYKAISTTKWFEAYMTLSFILSIIGIIHILIYLLLSIDIFPMTIDGVPLRSSYRLRSILMEPSCFSTFLTPAISYFFLCKGYMKAHKLKFIITFISFIATFSVTAVLGIFLICIFFCLRKGKVTRFILISLTIIGSVFAINSISSYKSITNPQSPDEVIKWKLAQSIYSLEAKDPYDFENLNLSTYASLTNYWIAFHAPNRIIGTGLGTHEENYERLYKSNYSSYGLNKTDAYSLFARLYSELGICGLILYFYFLYKFYDKKNIISTCLLIFFISYLIKGGHYTLYGIVFFNMLYYYSYKYKLNPQLINNA